MNFRYPANLVGRSAAAAAFLLTAVLWAVGGPLLGGRAFAADGKYDPTALAVEEISHRHVHPLDWPQWGGWTARNNTPEGKHIPIKFNAEGKENVRWAAKLGSQTYGNPVIANGKVFIGTNNGGGYVKRYPSSVDLGCLLCFDEKTGKFLWQDSNPKLPAGPRQRLAHAGRLQHALLRGGPALVRQQPGRSRLPRRQRLL